MNPPVIARQLFERLAHGDNLILSANGPEGDRALFRAVCDEEDACREYFLAIGLRLERGDNCYYFSAVDESGLRQEAKLGKLVDLIRLLDFLTQNIEGFGEGTIFSAVDLASRSQSDPRSITFLQKYAAGDTLADRVDDLLRQLTRRGYIDDLRSEHKEFRVLSAVNYLNAFADRLVIQGETPTSVQQ
jgi:hypothetical protein